MDDILKKIVATKHQEIAQLRPQSQQENWREKAEQTPPAASFREALAQPGRLRVIAEIKKASPSAGVIRPDFDPPAIASSYYRFGADCLSVLTDEQYFQGNIDYLRRVHQAVPLPLLRKDFILDDSQIFEAKLAGASAVLFIAECLEPDEMARLVALTMELGMDPLVELYDPENLDAVLATGTPLVGINNRNLRTFETSLRHTLDLLPNIPADRLVVSESGIRTPEDVDLLAASGVRAILVGEAFMRAAEPGERLAELLRLPIASR